MKIIKSLTVKVTYRVTLGNVKVSNEVYDALSQCYDDGGDVSPMGMTNEEAVAAEWLNDNISESDATDWEHEVEDFEE